jgi:O-antigen/teichoic acid export membrane protein
VNVEGAMNNAAIGQTAAKPRPVSLRKNFAWTFVGNLVNAGSLWALTVILAKRTTPETVGQFSYALALTTPIMLFASLKLRSAQATDQRHEYSFGEYWSLRLVTTIAAMAVIVVLALVNHSGPGLFWVVAIVGAAKGVESLSDIFYGLFQQQERMDLISASMIFRGLLTIALASVALTATLNIVALAGCLLLSWFTVLLVYDIPNARRLLAERGECCSLSPKRPTGRLWQLGLLTLPLGASIAVGSLYNNVPRYVIEHQLGTHDLGIFSAIAYFMLFGGMIFTALAQSIIPRLARYYAEGNLAGFRSLLVKLIGLGFGTGVSGVAVATFFGGTFIRLFYNASYAQHTDLLVLLMIATLVDFTLLSIGSAVNAMRQFRVQVVIGTISTVVMTPLCLILVGKMGLKGAALSMIGAKLVEATMYLYVANKYLRAMPKGSDA